MLRARREHQEQFCKRVHLLLPLIQHGLTQRLRHRRPPWLSGAQIVNPCAIKGCANRVDVGGLARPFGAFKRDELPSHDPPLDN